MNRREDERKAVQSNNEEAVQKVNVMYRWSLNEAVAEESLLGEFIL